MSLLKNGLALIANGCNLEGEKMECKDILNLIAIIVIPIVAVL